MNKFGLYRIIILLVSGQVLFGQAGEEMSLRKMTEAAIVYNARNNKQKVFLQPDKDSYSQNEKIWFKAYVFSGSPLANDTLSKNLYVELWTPHNKRVDIVRLKLNRGIGDGYFYLSDTLEEGIYHLRAFTDRMVNYPSEYYFNYTFAFHNSNYKYIISPKNARKNKKSLRRIDKQKADYSLYFFPEGGNIVNGRPVKMYYKATNAFGDFIGVKFRITPGFDSKDETSFSSETGLGKFTYKADENIKYKVDAVFGNGEHKVFSLPVPKKAGVWGLLTESKDSVYLKLTKPFRESNDPSANRYFVAINNNNHIQAVLVTDLRHDTVLVFAKNSFFWGINNFSIISNRQDVAANFKVFISPGHVEDTGLNVIDEGDSIKLRFDNSNLSKLWSGSLSIVDSDTGNNFLPEYINEKYLSSDIGGWYQPGLLTSGSVNNKWQNLLINTMPVFSPNWDKFFNKKNPKPVIPAENGIVIAGKIVTEIFSIPVKGASVKLEILSRYNDIFETETDNKGNFNFSGFDFYDTLQMKIIARKPSGRKGVLILLRNDPIPGVSEYNGNFFLTTTSLRDNKAYRRKQNAKATIEANRKDKEIEDYYKKVMHGRPDNIIYNKDVPQNMTVLEAIQGRVPGVNVTGDQVIIRGRGTILGSTDPLVLIDDVPADISILKNMSMFDVDRIEILKGPSTAIYGVRGGNGVIAVYTKHGEYMKKGEIDFTLVGYQKPERFSPAGSAGSKDQTVKPKTVFWLPEINVSGIKPDGIIIKKPTDGKVLKVRFFGINLNGKAVHQQVQIPLIN